MQHLQHIFQMILQKEEQNPRKPREIGKFGNKRRTKKMFMSDDVLCVFSCLSLCESILDVSIMCLHAPVISYCSLRLHQII